MQLIFAVLYVSLKDGLTGCYKTAFFEIYWLQYWLLTLRIALPRIRVICSIAPHNLLTNACVSTKQTKQVITALMHVLRSGVILTRQKVSHISAMKLLTFLLLATLLTGKNTGTNVNDKRFESYPPSRFLNQCVSCLKTQQPALLARESEQ